MTRFIPMPSPNGTNFAQKFLPADRFGPLLSPKAAYDSAIVFDEMDDDEREGVIKRVVTLLEGRLTPAELMAVTAILRTKPRTSGSTLSQFAEDGRRGRMPNVADHHARNAAADQRAREDFERRYPQSKRIEILPAHATEAAAQLAGNSKRHHAAPDMDAFYQRFPNACRIGQA